MLVLVLKQFVNRCKLRILIANDLFVKCVINNRQKGKIERKKKCFHKGFSLLLFSIPLQNSAILSLKACSACHNCLIQLKLSET